MANKKKKTHYAVRIGRRPGIYRSWTECQAQVEGFSNATFKGFSSQDDAAAFMTEGMPAETAAAAAPNASDEAQPNSKKARILSEAGNAQDTPTYSPIMGHILTLTDIDEADKCTPSQDRTAMRQGDKVDFGCERLNVKQQAAVDAAARGANVFITGPAGTGKSVVLRKILAHFREKYSCREGCYVAVAPTGPTAISVGGQTIHSFAGCGVPRTAGDFDKCWEKFKRENWRKLHAMVIEEISMISGEFLDRLSTVVGMIREDRQPFGGIQLILCGDFLQLPPIPMTITDINSSREALIDQEKDVELHQDRGFAFQSKAWQEAALKIFQLDQVFRQSNADFRGVLENIRYGKVTSTVMNFLKKCERSLPSNDIGVVPTKLYATNKDVRSENKMLLDRLPGNEFNFPASDSVEPEEGTPPSAKSRLRDNSFFRTCIAEEVLTLKRGAQVMLIKNESTQPIDKTRLVNGSRGVTIGFTDKFHDFDMDAAAAELLDDSDVSMKTTGPIYPVVSFRNGRTIIVGHARFDSRIVGLGTCVRSAVPLKLAWAVTVHKSQGLTLDCVKADVSGVFTEAQTYVALSRATDENALELRGFSRAKVRADVRALAFYSSPYSKFPTWNVPWEDEVVDAKARGEDGTGSQYHLHPNNIVDLAD